MIKQFCDVCGQEITDKNAAITMVANRPMRFSGILAPRPGVKFQVDVIHTLNDVGNGGNVCKYCLIDGVRSLDDRTQGPDERATFSIWKPEPKDPPGVGAVQHDNSVKENPPSPAAITEAVEPPKDKAPAA